MAATVSTEGWSLWSHPLGRRETSIFLVVQSRRPPDGRTSPSMLPSFLVMVYCSVEELLADNVFEVKVLREGYLYP
jgi:hypothetical protein